MLTSMLNLEPADSDFLLVVVVFEVLLEGLGQRHEVDPVIRTAVADGCSAQVLERERKVAVQGQGQHGLEEHAAARVFVVLNQSTHGVRGKNTRVMGVKAKLVVPLLDASMKGPAVAPEADREEEFLLGTVPQEKRTLRAVLQETFCFIAVHDAPVERTVGDLQEVWHHAVDVVHLGVYSRGDV